MSQKEDQSSKGPFIEYQDELLDALLQLTKASAFLANPQDLAFFRNASPSFSALMDSLNEDVLNCFGQVLAKSSKNKAMQSVMSHRAPESFVDSYAPVVECVDNLIEQTDLLLDAFKSGTPASVLSTAIANASNQNSAAAASTSRAHLVQPSRSEPSSSSARYSHPVETIPRPQLLFADIVDNSNLPALRKIIFKPNALVPLDAEDNVSAAVSAEMGQHLQSLGISPAQPILQSYHPYKYEIQNIQYPASLFRIAPERPYLPLEQTPFTWVDELGALESVMRLLCAADCFAVDLEHHDFRSFLGFTCLMQISTKDEDFVIDTLALRAHMHILNTPFTDPKIVKIFHGASSDIEWLQKDFGLYIVGLFDTFHASHALSMPEHSLAYLLSYYCQVKADKKYQLADWRIRPIPEEMMKYARSDTHYLIYIFDRMRNSLLENSGPESSQLVDVCLERSAAVSLKVYLKPIYDSEQGLGKDGWKSLLKKQGSALTPEQFAVFKVIHGWRDHIARKEDESVRYIMPNHILMNLVQRMPSSSEGIIASCRTVPIFVKAHAFELCKMIEQSRVSYRMASEEKNKELQRIKAEIAEKEKELRLKKRVHIRFNEPNTPRVLPTESVAESTDSPVIDSYHKIKLSTNSGTEGATVPLPIASSIRMESRSSFYGSLLDDEPLSASQQDRKLKADKIRTSLYLAAPKAEDIFTPHVDQDQLESLSANEEDVEEYVNPEDLEPASEIIAASTTEHTAPVVDEKVEFDLAPVLVPNKKKRKQRTADVDDQEAEATAQKTQIVSDGDQSEFKPFDYAGDEEKTDYHSYRKKDLKSESYNPYNGHHRLSRVGNNASQSSKKKSGKKAKKGTKINL